MKKITTGQSNSGFSETGIDVLAWHVESGKIPGLVALVSRYGGVTELSCPFSAIRKSCLKDSSDLQLTHPLL
ncbi:hypothetical protein [Peribacillus sp. NPDC097895]|uniref:hypothetical protein n=1 Tax=Peribacillus sp. NPDC097895 TaxID=3390619 RepID=UPI003CFF2FFB